MLAMNRERFELLVEEALAEIPEPFQSHLQDVQVVIDDRASAATLRELGLDPQRDEIYGLYEGTPLDERGDGEVPLLPDRITVYYRPLVRDFRTAWAIRREVRRTVIHEVGHFFGLDEDEVEGEGY